jgi:hypothetical protein
MKEKVQEERKQKNVDYDGSFSSFFFSVFAGYWLVMN